MTTKNLKTLVKKCSKKQGYRFTEKVIKVLVKDIGKMVCKVAQKITSKIGQGQKRSPLKDSYLTFVDLNLTRITGSKIN
jgi:hypothetical protein